MGLDFIRCLYGTNYSSSYFNDCSVLIGLKTPLNRSNKYKTRMRKSDHQIFQAWAFIGLFVFVIAIFSLVGAFVVSIGIPHNLNAPATWLGFITVVGLIISWVENKYKS